MNKSNLAIAFLLTFCLSLYVNLQVRAQRCVSLPLVGGKGTEVDKTLTTPSVPSILGVRIARDNWNTDWSIPNSHRFETFQIKIVSDEGGTFNVKSYFKYSDDTADPFYERNDIELEAGESLTINGIPSRTEQPYQVNLFVGGVKHVGSQYRASILGCR